MIALQLVHQGSESCRYCLTGHPADHTTCVSLALGTNMYAHFHKTALKTRSAGDMSGDIDALVPDS